ncbi:MAG: UbiD family decarboxylase [Chloroflexi bacterium]|nr:UbiD family decarboxylase [Chloroflexota bacterium]
MRKFTESLRARGELLVVEREVDPRFELAAVTAKVGKTSNKAVLFNRVRGTRFPVVTNLYGSRERLASVIGIEVGDFCREWGRLTTPGRFAGAYTRDVPMPGDLVYGKLSDLPLITYCERDAGPYFTSAIFLGKEPETGVPNLSFHRSMYVSDEELRVRLGPTHHLTIYHEKAEAMGKPLEAAILIGPPPAVVLAAAAPVPYEADELEVAAQLAGRPIDMRPCRSIDVMVPADTEIVVEGRFLPNERRPEGPFGEFMGYYVEVGNNAVFEVLDVSWRPGALFHSILSGSGEELRTLELALAANIYQRVSAVLPGIVDVTCTPFVTHAVIKVRQKYEGHARQVLLAALGAAPTWCKVCTVVDEDVDIYDMDDVMWAVLTRARVDQAVMVLQNIPSFYRDAHKDHWGRLAIDATIPWGRKAEFERKRVPGAADLDLGKYLAPADAGSS